MILDFSTKTGFAGKTRSGALIVATAQGNPLSGAAASIDTVTGKALSRLVRHGDITGKLAHTVVIHELAGIEAERVIVVGLGRPDELKEGQFLKAVAAAVKRAADTGASDACIALEGFEVKGRDAAWLAERAVLAAAAEAYRFDSFKSKKDNGAFGLKSLAILAKDAKEEKAFAESVRRARAIAHGVALTKDLGNTPPNVCNPAYLAESAKKLAKQFKLKCTVLERKDMEKLGMGSFLAVARGATSQPKLIVLEYHGGRKGDKPHALVGKGITFDTGGISLKPGDAMDEMKFDMCGAASVIGTFRAIAELKPAINLIGVIPACENMPDGDATRPGDIVTTMSGQTVEILNTDAEGRLILCDALTYTEKFTPQSVVDIATLTGACVIALGHVATGLFSNDDTLANELIAAGTQAWDRAWHMPVWDDYQEQLKTNFADMANIGGRPGGSITAACFLSRYAKKFKWAHLDIAGTAWKSGSAKGATGRPVPLLTHYLMSKAR